MLNKQDVKKVLEQIKQNITEKDKNIACVVGEITSYPIHIGNGMVETMIKYTSKKGIVDNIPLKMCANLNIEIEPGKKYLVIGESRSEAKDDNYIKRYLWANKIEEVAEDVGYLNFIYLKAYLCKKIDIKFIDDKPVSCGIVCIESSAPNEYYYVPIIGWHVNAFRIERTYEWDMVIIYGWIQTREYFKDDKSRLGYEISIKTMRRL